MRLAAEWHDSLLGKQPQRKIVASHRRFHPCGDRVGPRLRNPLERDSCLLGKRSRWGSVPSPGYFYLHQRGRYPQLRHQNRRQCRMLGQEPLRMWNPGEHQLPLRCYLKAVGNTSDLLRFVQDAVANAWPHPPRRGLTDKPIQQSTTQPIQRSMTWRRNLEEPHQTVNDMAITAVGRHPLLRRPRHGRESGASPVILACAPGPFPTGHYRIAGATRVGGRRPTGQSTVESCDHHPPCRRLSPPAMEQPKEQH